MDATIHAALVAVIAWLLKLAFLAVGIDVGEDVYMSLAGIIVAYILSLLGLGIWTRISAKARGLLYNQPAYKPPFT